MTSEYELWACASEMIHQHRDDAGAHAAMRADELLEAGDRVGAATWVQITNRIGQLGAQAGTVH